MKQSATIEKIAPALVRAQKKMGAATKDAANPFFKSKYADLGAIMEVCKEPLNNEGITILQPAYSEGGSHYLETILLHESGEYISTYPLKLELKQTDMQSFGSAVSYGRRYQLQALLSIPSEDDDGQLASKPVMAPIPAAAAPAQTAAPKSTVKKTPTTNSGGF